MAYKQWLAGWANKVLAVGRVAYGGDGTDLYPINVDSTGQNLTLLASTAAIGSLVAGTAKIGTVSGILYESRKAKAIAASAAYAANDVVNDTTCTTTAVGWEFTTVVASNGAYGRIESATIFSETPNISPRLSLFLFNAEPTGVNEDKVTNTNPLPGDRTKYIGKIEFPALKARSATCASESSATPSTVGGVPFGFKCASATRSIYGILVTEDIFTQVATDDIEITMQIEQL